MQTVVAGPGRGLVSMALSALVGLALLSRLPFPDENNLLQLVRLEAPSLFYVIKGTYITLLFTTPYIGFSLLFSLAYIFMGGERAPGAGGRLPPYPEAASRDKLFLVIGELHHSRRPVPAENPRWLVIPDRGLFTGLAIFGAVGSGKTTCCMVPFVEQVLAFRSEDQEKRVGGLVLEVKGDFCHRLQALLTKYNRREDYIELSLQGDYR